MKKITIILICLGVAGFLYWSDGHTSKVMEAGDKYTKCVQNEYGVTPFEWFQNYGEYPVCKI